MVADEVRMGMMSASRAKNHPERGMLLRSLGHELIVSIDRIAMPLLERDRLILCSDGLHNVLDDKELESLTRGVDPETGCRNLIDEANKRGTPDNLTCAVFRMTSPTGHTADHGWMARSIARIVRAMRRLGAVRDLIESRFKTEIPDNTANCNESPRIL